MCNSTRKSCRTDSVANKIRNKEQLIVAELNMLPIIARFFQIYAIFVLITTKFGMQQKKSERKLVKMVKNYYFCNKFLRSVVSKY